MLFNSLAFLLFLPIVLVLFYALPHKFRWILSLIASYVFYMFWEPGFAILILGSTVVDFFAAKWMAVSASKRKQKILLAGSLTFNLGLLFFFKYFNFFREVFADIYGVFGSELTLDRFDILLPVGISFYTFQTLSYTIDVYKKRIEPETHFGYFALYVAYWPQLVAGPIERPKRLLPQLRAKVTLQAENLRSGFILIGYGLFKKVVIADRLAVFVDAYYNDVTSYGSWSAWTATIFFAFQIYCDFSGYSDIARGCARLMGVDLIKNFKIPYLSANFTEFWNRWHISLSTWFRDYVYIPLGGNRRGIKRQLINVLITFMVSGLWHGANWTFVAWGALHGVFLVVQILLKIKLPRVLAIALTFLFTCLAWVFFVSHNVSDAWFTLKNMISFNGSFLELANVDFINFMLLGLIFVVFLPIEFLIDKRNDFEIVMQKSPVWIRNIVWAAGLFVIITLGKFDQATFIYFQF